MGFEPTVRYKRTQHFQCCALNHLDHLSKVCENPLDYYTMFLKKSKSFFKKSIKDLGPLYIVSKSCQY